MRRYRRFRFRIIVRLDQHFLYPSQMVLFTSQFLLRLDYVGVLDGIEASRDITFDDRIDFPPFMTGVNLFDRGIHPIACTEAHTLATKFSFYC